MVTKTFIPSNLCDCSDIIDSIDSSDSCDKNSKCDKTQIVTKLENSDYHKTQKFKL